MPKKRVKKHGAGLKIGDVGIKLCDHEREERCHTTGMNGEEIEQRLNAEVVYEDTSTGHDGPAHVNSDAFLEGWERTFGRRRSKQTSAPN